MTNKYLLDVPHYPKGEYDIIPYSNKKLFNPKKGYKSICVGARGYIHIPIHTGHEEQDQLLASIISSEDFYRGEVRILYMTTDVMEKLCPNFLSNVTKFRNIPVCIVQHDPRDIRKNKGVFFNNLTRWQ